MATGSVTAPHPPRPFPKKSNRQKRSLAEGEIDFVLKCVAPDLKTFQAFVEKLTAAPNVRNVKTSLTLRNSKDAAMVPMED